jgi:hypothetical protein
VTALLTGPGALGPRWGGALGAISSRAWARLTGKNAADSNPIGYRLVADIGTAITLNVSRAAAGVDGFEEWARTRIIAAIPGAGKDPQ